MTDSTNCPTCGHEVISVTNAECCVETHNYVPLGCVPAEDVRAVVRGLRAHTHRHSLVTPCDCQDCAALDRPAIAKLLAEDVVK